MFKISSITFLVLTNIFLIIAFGFIYSQMNEDFGFTQAIDPYYFSLTTLSTVGYGDFTPKTTRAKMLVMFHQFIILLQVVNLIQLYLVKYSKYVT